MNTRAMCLGLTPLSLERLRKNQDERVYARYKAGAAWAYRIQRYTEADQRRAEAAQIKHLARKQWESKSGERMLAMIQADKERCKHV